jgi:hypothetical protein
VGVNLEEGLVEAVEGGRVGVVEFVHCCGDCELFSTALYIPRGWGRMSTNVLVCMGETV